MDHLVMDKKHIVRELKKLISQIENDRFCLQHATIHSKSGGIMESAFSEIMVQGPREITLELKFLEIIYVKASKSRVRRRV